MKGVYVVKSDEDKAQAYEPRKQTESRGLYVLRTSEEVVNKFADIVYDFVDEGGFFLMVGADKIFYQTLKRCLVFELGVETEYLQIVQHPSQAVGKITEDIKENLFPFIFIENMTDGQSNLPILSTIKSSFPLLPIIVTTGEVDKDHLLQLHEEGATHVLRKSSSVNEVVRKIVHILKPQTEIDELARVGCRLNCDNHFDEAVRVANTMLTKRPKSARAHIIMGDAYRGLAKRRAALAEYALAEKNSEMFIEPLKKIFMMYAEDGDKAGMLEYLIKLDNLSPLNFNRKVKIGDLNYDMGEVEKAEEYYDKAIEAAFCEAKSIVGEMSLDIAERVMATRPEMAAKYFRISLDLIKDARGRACMNTFNRLGISLRKAGLWQEAIEAYVAAEKLSPGDENIQYNIGLAHLDGAEYDASACRMMGALRINPNMYKGNVEVAYNFGVAFKASGNLPIAEKMIKHVLKLDPYHSGARELGGV